MDYLISLLLFTFIAGVTPGPNNLMLLSSGANYGVVRSLPHYFGACLGFPVLVIFIGFGMGTVLINLPNAFLVMKILGTGYLLYLSWRIANSGDIDDVRCEPKPLSFAQAALFQWVNPKAWVIAMAVLAAFTMKESPVKSVIIIVLFYLITSLISKAAWLIFGNSFKRYLNTKRRRNILNYSMAFLLVISLVPVIFMEIE